MDLTDVEFPKESITKSTLSNNEFEVVCLCIITYVSIHISSWHNIKGNARQNRSLCTFLWEIDAVAPSNGKQGGH